MVSAMGHRLGDLRGACRGAPVFEEDPCPELPAVAAVDSVRAEVDHDWDVRVRDAAHHAMPLEVDGHLLAAAVGASELRPLNPDETVALRSRRIGRHASLGSSATSIVSEGSSFSLTT